MTVAATLWAASAFAAAGDTNEEKHAQVDKVFADLQKPGSPGCALAVLSGGKIAYERGYGLASVELNAPITPQTVFDIGSTSKQFTAASILVLEQQGKLSINDDVRKYIPELPDYSKSGGQPVTILNLLNHTSGMRDYLSLIALSGANGDSVTTDDDALALVARQKALNFPAGSEWAYSNTGYFLLSVIVKRVSGMTLREFASRNIFQPLEMTHTTFRDDHTMLIPNRALAYDPGEKSGYKLDVSYFEQLGDGAVHTSVEDLAKWDENFYSLRVGGKTLVAGLQERGKLNTGKVLEYARGLFIQQSRGLHTVRHGGAWGGYRAELLRFPDQHFSVACLCNLGNSNPEKRADQVAEVYLGALMKPAEGATGGDEPASSSGVALTASQTEAITGMYRNPKTKGVARIAVVDGKLQIQFFGSAFGMRALNATRFTVTDFPVNAQLSFDVAEGNKVMKVSGDELVAATYQRVVEATPSLGELARYAGDFRSQELGVIYRIQVVDAKLRLAGLSDGSGLPRTGMPTPLLLAPTIADEFEISSQGITVHFARSASGAVTGFQLDAGRTQGIEFARSAP